MNIKTSNNKTNAFTIVELLVVIVVIGILAAITIVAYRGISGKAIEASLESDLTNASQQLKLFQVENSAYPDTISCAVPDSSTNKCIKASGSNTFTYTSDNDTTPQTFTLDATNGTTVYRITNDSTPVAVTTTPITAIAAISGTTTVGSLLTAGALTPSGATVTYQWQSATTSGGTYTNIPDATASTYTLVASDWPKYIKVVATATGSYTGTQTSAASTVVSDPNWIAGIAATALAGKYVRNADLGSTYMYKTTYDAVVSPQGATGLDPNYPSNMSLVSPQTNSGVDFSAYPAQNACKAIGGRLPNMQELLAIYADYVDQAIYGNFQTGSYYSSTEYSSTDAYSVHFGYGLTLHGYKTNGNYVRCVAG